MGIRKKVRTKWKQDRKDNIKKVSAQRLKKARKLEAANLDAPKPEAKKVA